LRTFDHQGADIGDAPVADVGHDGKLHLPPEAR
jgi:hypothetical protein